MAAFDVSTLANVATAVAVIIALVFGMLQFRQFQTKRHDVSVAQLINANLSPDFMRSLRLVASTPAEQVDAGLRAQNPAMEAAAQNLHHVYEGLGVLVFQRIIPLSILDDLIGMRTRNVWRKLQPWIERNRQGENKNAGEWFQWLCERLIENQAPGRMDGAHVTHRSWKP